jgi:regulatory protein
VADDAYAAGLKLLGRRELSEAQLRTRLARRRFDSTDIDRAVARLQRDKALDDYRTALACARTELTVKRHGQARVLRQIESLGIARDMAREAVREVFADVDEDALLAEALARLLRRGLPLDAAGLHRIHRYLIAQGFDAGRVTSLLRRYSRTALQDGSD